MIHELRITITRWSLRFIEYRVHTVLYFLRISWFLVKSEIGDRTVSSPAILLFFFLICPLINKVEAGNYLTSIRFKAKSMSLIKKEARTELKSVHYGDVELPILAAHFSTFRVFILSFRPLLVSFTEHAVSRLVWDTRVRRVFAGYRVAEIGTAEESKGCCRFNWRSFVTSKRSMLWYSRACMQFHICFCSPFLRPFLELRFIGKSIGVSGGSLVEDGRRWNSSGSFELRPAAGQRRGHSVEIFI